MIPANLLSRLNLLTRTLTWDCGFIEKGNELKVLHNGLGFIKFEVLEGNWLEVTYNGSDFGDMAKWKVGDLITIEDLFNAVKFAVAPAHVS